MGRFKPGLSFKVAVVVTLLLTLAFVAVISLVTSTVTRQARDSLSSQTSTYVDLATRSVGEAFVLYKDDDAKRRQDSITAVANLNNAVTNISIFNGAGERLFSIEPVTDLPSVKETQLLDPLFISDSEGFMTRVVYPYVGENAAHRFTIVYDIQSDEAKNSVSRLSRDILTVGLVVLFFADIISVLAIEYLFVRPLRKMNILAASISAGNYGPYVKSSRKDEIGELNRTLNAMASKLQEDIEQLKNAEQLKSEFLIISSHSLRTPLTVMTGYLELLQELPLDKKAKEYLSTIVQYSDKLNDLTGDMLTVAELEETSKPRITTEVIDVKELLQQFVPLVQPSIDKNAQTLKTDLGQENLYIKTHATYLQTALWNLIENASKFTPNQGIITINLKRQGNNAVISVTDTGMGITDTEKAKLFTKFHRGTSVMKYQYEGLGLGLYMTKLIIELLGGTIGAESQQDKGSTFSIKLPLAVARTGAVTGKPSKNILIR